MPARRTHLPAVLRALSLALVLALACAGPAQARATTAQKVVAIARYELAKGVHEIPDGSNRAPAIRRYDAATTPHWYGAPWCAYFVSYVARAAGVPIGPGGSGIGYVPTIRAWAKSTGRWRRTPHSGDLITFPEHVGIVENVYANHTITTIEGNAGNAVRRRWRTWSSAMGYVRIASGAAGTKSPSAAPKPNATGNGGGGARQPATARQLVARITAYPGTTIAVGQSVDFSSDDSTGDVVRADWDLNGDGRYDAHGETVTRRFTAAGVFPIRLRVTDRSHRTSVATLKLSVRADHAPVARFTLPAVIYAGQAFTADASSSSDADGRIVKYEWDLNGDGNWGEDGARHAMTIDQPGDYDAGLRVTDDAGNVTEWHTNLHVAAPPDPVSIVNCDSDTVHTGDTLRCVVDDSQSPSRIVKHEWDTNDDGDFSDARGSRVWVSFDAPGDQALRERVTDDHGTMAIMVVTIHVLDRPPVPALTLPAHPQAGTALTFDASGSTDPDSAIAKYEWDLDGDGVYEQATTDPTATGRYAAPGSYQVSMRVTDDFGQSAVVTRTLVVPNLAPTAALAVPAKIVKGQAASFDASASADADGSVVKYEWDLNGDGSYEQTTTSPRLTVTYAYGGYVTVHLRVTDDRGTTATASQQIRVLVGPTASVRMTSSRATTVSATSFSGSYSSDPDGTIVRYDWDFNNDGVVDKSTTTASTSTWFTTAGSTTVRLTVVDSNGLSASATLPVTVTLT